jgi:oligopeptide/dipeptide ABC transporter ATP-binding protein
MNYSSPLLDVRNLEVHFSMFAGIFKAVDGVSFSVEKGETLGIVGESGCGKTVTALSILRLIPEPPGRIKGGTIYFKQANLLETSRGELRKIRGNKISMIFQEPMTALNPVLTLGRQIAETLRLHRGLNKKESWSESVELLRRVGIPSPETRAGDYPHQMSGGMRQRAMIAMAIACEPELLVADEPTTALDVTIQAQILDLIQELKEEMGMAVLLITHNFGIIAETAKRTAVMYGGKIVEEADTGSLLESPLHPYTRGLLRCLPRIGAKPPKRRQRLYEISGIVPQLKEDSRGCAFFPRCPVAKEACRREDPDFIEVEKGHHLRCFV